MMRQLKKELVEVYRINVGEIDVFQLKELLRDVSELEDSEDFEAIYGQWIVDNLWEIFMYSEEAIIELKEVEDAKDFLSNINHLCEEIKYPNVEDIRAVIANLPQYLYDVIETFANSSTSNISQKHKAMNVLNYYKEHPTITNEVDKTLIRYR